MPRLHTIFLLLLFWAFEIHAQRQPEFHVFNTDNGLSSNDVRCVYQDSKGFIWAGTVSGLSRFNAYEFDVFESDPSNPQALSDNNIRAIYEDRDGFIWIGTINGGLNRFDPKTKLFKSWQAVPDQEGKLTDNSIYSIIQDKEGLLWLATKSGGLNCFDPKTETFSAWKREEDNPEALPANSLWILHYEEESGVLWIGTSNGLCTMSEKGIFKRIEGVSDIIASINPIGDDIWVGTWGSGVCKIKKSTQQLTQRWDEPQGLPDRSITGTFPSQYGGIWLSTYESGLIHFYPESNQFKVFKTGLTRADYNWHMIADQSGNLWAATLGGLVQHQVAVNSGFKLFTTENTPKLSADLITLIEGSSMKNIWVGTLGRAIRYDFSTADQPQVTGLINFPTLSGDYMIRGVAQAPDGSFWVSTWRNGIYRFVLDENGEVKKEEKLSKSKDFPRINDVQIISTFKDSKNRLWVSSLIGLSYIDLNTLEFKNYIADPKKPNSLSDNYTYQVYESKDGTIWIATAKGLSRFNEESEDFTVYINEPSNKVSLTHNKIRVLFEDSKDKLWVGTDGGGLNCFDREKDAFQPITEEDGLSGNSIKGIVEDVKGNLWVTTNKGLTRLSPDRQSFKNYDTSDGLQGNDFGGNTTIVTPSGYILAGGAKGFNVFHPDQLKENEFIPPVILSSFKMLGKEVPIYQDSLFFDSPLKQSIGYTENLELSHEDKVVEFEFAALNFIKPQKNKYKYIMKGFETEWRETTAERRFATYTNLPKGKDLVFTVLASNNDGKWNETGTSITIYVKPPFWETWWFRLIILLAITAGVLAFFSARTARLKRQKERLEAQVKERTQELQTKQEEVLAQNEELHQQQEEILAQRDHIEQKNLALTEQKEEVEKSYRNVNILADIGQEVTASLDLPTVIQRTYESVNQLMDASGFGIGIFEEVKKEILFKGYIEKGKVLPSHSTPYAPESDLASWSIHHQKEVMINDTENEYSNYIEGAQIKNIEGEMPQSLIYLPLILNEKVVGVITVQSFERHAYSENNFMLLRNLATYISIAVGNAESYREVKKSRDVIKAKNKDIMDSLRYAETIQQSVLPLPERMNQLVTDHFIIFRPKDLVSGDFYWATETEGKIFMAVVDCTGHGVPGAFMSLIGRDLLDGIIVKEKVYDPAKVLAKMHQSIREILQQDQQLNSDGMDLSICMIEYTETEEVNVTFAAAKRPLFYTENGVFKETKGDRKSIGGWQKTENPTFTNIPLTLQKGDMMYLTTDGYVDQNNDAGKKYGTRKFRQVLTNISSLDTQMQYECLTNELNTHQKHQEQRDDITVMGIKV